MDSRTLLGEAVFQLTPTRTRCDLLAVAAGDGTRERIASGLVAPFLSHLRSARDQIPRGGYSFSLRPPSAAPWFTAGTVRRFVRFVATPEILERVVTIENEIVQIEDEIDRTLVSTTSEAAGENSKHDLLLVLENRKKMLQKEQGMAYARASIAGYEKSHIDDLVMFSDAFGASRLREACTSFKELCAEKEKDKLWVDELAALEASGHSLLSSVQSSGIMLASEPENNAPSEQTNTAPNGMGFTSWNQGQHMATNADASQNKHQVPMGWMPEYMYGFHGPMGPNSAPFQGYAYPGMQFIPPYSIHPANPQRRSHDEEFNSNGHYVDNNVEHKHSELRSESDDGGSFDKNHQQKISKKNPSRKIVIRNINYISKQRPAESDESEESSDNDDLLDEDFLRHEVEGIVGSFEKHKGSKSKRHHSRSKSGKRNPDVLNGSSDVDKETKDADTDKKTNDSWGAFQNILMKDESISQDMDPKGVGQGDDNKQQHMPIVDEYCTIKSKSLMTSSTYDYQQLEDKLGKVTIPNIVESDPIIVDGRHTSSGGAVSVKNFEGDDNNCQSIKRAQNDNEEFLLSQRNSAVISASKDFSNFIDETPAIRNQKDGDWFVVTDYENKLHKESGNGLTFEEELIQKPKDQHYNERRVEDAVFDDSVVVTERSLVHEKTFSSLEADMSIISGIVDDGPSKTSNQPAGYVVSASHEPDDLQMLFGRDSIAKQVSTSSFPEVDFSADMYVRGQEKNSSAEPDNSTTDEKLCNNKAQRNNNAKLSHNDRKPKSLYSSLAKSRSEVLTRNRKLSNMSKEAIQRTKAQMEEENRKRLEQLTIERQKRIAQRSVNGSALTAAKQSKTNVNSVTNSSKPEKKTGQSKVQEKSTMGTESSRISRENKQNGFGHVTKVQHPTGTIRKI